VADYVFLCYSQHDRPYVDRLVAFLAAGGVTSWYDFQLVTGDRWDQVLTERIKNSAAVLVVMTPESDQSLWVNRELNYATDLGKPIIPLLLAGEPFMALADIQYADVRGGTMPSDTLLALIRSLTTRPEQVTPSRAGSSLANPVVTKIFLGYRRSDAAFPAHWLFEHLSHRFDRVMPKGSIFMDVDIDLGVDFEHRVRAAIIQCRVLLVLVGSTWLTVVDEDGIRRLDDPEDMVRREIELGIENRVRIVPVVLRPATMPKAKYLPDSIRPFATLNAAFIDAETFRADADKLADRLENMLGM
jgi:hypothetical protein